MSKSSNNITADMRAEFEARYLETACALRDASAAAAKTVSVTVATDSLKDLKDNGYRMCFAKKVGTESYNVIWQSYKNFSENNKFSWVPDYQIFRTDTFEAEVVVEVSSNPKDIGLGQITTIDKYGTLTDPVTGGVETALNVNNEYQATHIGISQMSTGIDGKKVATPIYVSENKCMTGKANFKPVEKVLIWFECDAKTSTMFTEMKTNSIELDLTTKNAVNVKYEDEKWSII